MAVHVLRIAAATALIILITLLPFLPGSYDPLAATLSAIARLFGFAGVLLVPVGVLWTVSVYWRPLSGWEYARTGSISGSTEIPAGPPLTAVQTS
jgi:hypothetical protein